MFTLLMIRQQFTTVLISMTYLKWYIPIVVIVQHCLADSGMNIEQSIYPSHILSSLDPHKPPFKAISVFLLALSVTLHCPILHGSVSSLIT